LGTWLKWYNACLACARPLVQTPVTTKAKQKSKSKTSQKKKKKTIIFMLARESYK
jgi:hypothetical protein